MVKNDFELSFPSLTDFLLNENSMNKFSVLGINDLPNFQFDRNNVDSILIKKNSDSTLWFGIYFTNDTITEIYYFEAKRNNKSFKSDLEVYFTKKITLFSELEQVWKTRINKSFPNV